LIRRDRIEPFRNPTGNPANRTIASSLVIDGNVFTTSTRGRPFIGFRGGGSGNITGKNELWTNNLGADVPTPTTDGKHIYVLGDNGAINCLAAETGKVIYQGKWKSVAGFQKFSENNA
jgi:outer membrane protein assembly factor BamB